MALIRKHYTRKEHIQKIEELNVQREAKKVRWRQVFDIMPYDNWDKLVKDATEIFGWRWVRDFITYPMRISKDTDKAKRLILCALEPRRRNTGNEEFYYSSTCI